MSITIDRMLIGWNEWCSLPKFGIPAIKAKIDTGAKTSALHALNIQSSESYGNKIVSFELHPLQNDRRTKIHCQANIIDERYIMSSNGHKEHRYVISTLLELGGKKWDIELTLSDRDPLKFRMLLGREALSNRVVIDPHHALLQKKISLKTLHALYR